MEDILLIMYKENKCFPFLILEDGQYIFIGDYKNPVRYDDYREISDNSYQIILSIESILDKNYFVNSKGIIEYRKPYCSKCYSRKVIKKDYNWKTLYLEINVPVRVKVRRYFCHKCGKKSQTEFFEFYNKYSNFSNEFKNKIKYARQRNWISLRGIKQFIKDLFDINISHETIRKELLVEGEFNYLIMK